MKVFWNGLFLVKPTLNLKVKDEYDLFTCVDMKVKDGCDVITWKWKAGCDVFTYTCKYEIKKASPVGWKHLHSFIKCWEWHSISQSCCVSMQIITYMYTQAFE